MKPLFSTWECPLNCQRPSLLYIVATIVKCLYIMYIPIFIFNYLDKLSFQRLPMYPCPRSHFLKRQNHFGENIEASSSISRILGS